MKSFNINEVKESKLSADFTHSGGDWHTTEAKQFLKALDHRAEELNLSKETVYKAIREYWSGNFAQALKVIWGSKVKSAKDEANGGTESIYTYSIAGYGVFTEKYTRNDAFYLHSITFDPDDAESNCYELTHLLNVKCSNKGLGFDNERLTIERAAFKIKSLYIMNALFVGFSSRDLGAAFCTLKRKNKIPK